jgi:hypothetical protein
MIIKRWDTTLNSGNGGWAEQYPKTTVGNVYTQNGTTQIFDTATNKILPTYLPNFVAGGLKFRSSVTAPQVDTNAELLALIHSARGDFYSSSEPRSMVGVYWVANASNNASFPINNITTSTQHSTSGIYYCVIFEQNGEEQSGSGGLSVESGDWVIITSFTGAGTSSDDPHLVRLGVINNTYQVASTTAYGIAKYGFTTSDKNYAVQLSSGNAYVNVPWENDVYSHPTVSYADAAGTETTLTDITLIDSLTVSSEGHVSASTSRKLVAGTNVTITAANTGNITIASTDTTYTCATTSNSGFVKLSHDKLTAAVTTQPAGTAATRYYGVSTTSTDQLIVNVPWENTTYTTASNTVLGLIKTGYNQANTQGLVTLPAEASKAGSRQYGVQVDSNGLASVYVPWSDSNTTYSAGNGIALSTTTFSVAAGIGLTQEASGLKMTQPFVSSAATPAADYQVANNLWFDF